MTNEAAARPLPAPEAIAQALTLHQRGRFDEAEQIYDVVLAADPDNFDALHLCGVLQHQQGQSIEGLRLVAAALKAQPGAADALINYGVILEALKRHQEALAAFDEALGSHAESASAHYNRGRTLSSLGRHAEALASYEKALALAPSGTPMHGSITAMRWPHWAVTKRRLTITMRCWRRSRSTRRRKLGAAMY